MTQSSEAAAGDGGRGRVAELYLRYGPAIYRRCHQLLRSRDAAQDATQEVFVRLMSNMAKLESRENLLPWMYQVATHHCLNVLRASAHRVGTPSAAEEVATRLDHGDRQLARILLSRVDAATQAVAVAILVDGLEHSEVARALGVSRRTVARKLERFLQHARTYAALVADAEPAGGDDAPDDDAEAQRSTCRAAEAGADADSVARPRVA